MSLECDVLQMHKCDGIFAMYGHFPYVQLSRWTCIIIILTKLFGSLQGHYVSRTLFSAHITHLAHKKFYKHFKMICFTNMHASHLVSLI